MESVDKRLAVDWPCHPNGERKKLSEMSAAERAKVAKEAMDGFDDIPVNYLADFDRAFNEVFGVE